MDILFDVLKFGVKGLILDLRYNPGGSLPAMVTIASQFLEEERGLVMYQIHADGERLDRPIEPQGIAGHVPLVVLVNEETASAGEVLAGAFQYHQRAPVIGTKTFGKGTVNSLLRLSDGSAIYLATAQWFTPGGEPIEGVGITPDIIVELTEMDIEIRQDRQLQRALEELQELMRARQTSFRS